MNYNKPISQLDVDLLVDVVDVIAAGEHVQVRIFLHLECVAHSAWPISVNRFDLELLTVSHGWLLGIEGFLSKAADQLITLDLGLPDAAVVVPGVLSEVVRTSEFVLEFVDIHVVELVRPVLFLLGFGLCGIQLHHALDELHLAVLALLHPLVLGLDEVLLHLQVLRVLLVSDFLFDFLLELHEQIKFQRLDLPLGGRLQAHLLLLHQILRQNFDVHGLFANQLAAAEQTVLRRCSVEKSERSLERVDLHGEDLVDGLSVDSLGLVMLDLVLSLLLDLLLGLEGVAVDALDHLLAVLHSDDWLHEVGDLGLFLEGGLAAEHDEFECAFR